MEGLVKVSAIIPVLDEEARIGARLAELGDLAAVDEIVVVDGGSSDRTRERVVPPAQLLEARRGRAVQMNAGARASSGDVLLFLHADVSLPKDARGQMERALGGPRVVAGAFRTRHVADGGRGAPWLRLADLRSRYTGLPYGDQALFVRREAFERAGGFPDQPLMEDLELSRRLRRLGRIARVPASVQVSGRRFLAHPIRAALLVNTFPLLYWLGVPPDALARIYRNVR
jgi:rSAM/selenodomain-associated transferase 2